MSEHTTNENENENDMTDNTTSNGTSESEQGLRVENGEIRFVDALDDEVRIYPAESGRLEFEMLDSDGMFLNQPLAAALAPILAHYARTGRLENPPAGALDRETLGRVAHTTRCYMYPESNYASRGWESLTAAAKEDEILAAEAVAAYVLAQTPEPVELDRDWLERLVRQAWGFCDNPTAAADFITNSVLARYAAPAPIAPQPAGVVEALKECAEFLNHTFEPEICMCKPNVACESCSAMSLAKRARAALSALQPAGSEGEDWKAKYESCCKDRLGSADRLVNLTAERDALRAQVVTLEAERDRLKAEAEKADKEYDDASDHFNDVLDELRKVIARVREAKKEIYEDNAKLRAEVERLKAEVSEKNERNDRLSEENTRLCFRINNPTPSDPRRVYDGMRVRFNNGIHGDFEFTIIKTMTCKDLDWRVHSDHSGLIVDQFTSDTLPSYLDPLPAEPVVTPFDLDAVEQEKRDEKLREWERERPKTVEPSFDFLAHLQRQRDWSEKTFGPGARTAGVIDHIRKELREIEADPTDISEWIDVVILGLDGAWRAGHSPEEIIASLVGKQTKNEGRTWPDWRTMSADQAIEHVRSDTPPIPEPAGEIVLPEAVNGVTKFDDGSSVIKCTLVPEWIARKVDGEFILRDGLNAQAYGSREAAARALAAIGQGPGAKVNEAIVPDRSQVLTEIDRLRAENNRLREVTADALRKLGRGPVLDTSDLLGENNTCPKCGEDRGHGPLCFKCDMAEQIARTPEAQPARPPFDVERLANAVAKAITAHRITKGVADSEKAAADAIRAALGGKE